MSKTFANSINNNPLYAERAEQDASGNVITTTYATKSEVSAVDEVPAVTSSDDAKVLTATYSGGVGSYAWAAASSGTTYTAGYGIGIDPNDNNAIHVNPDGILGGISVTLFGVGAKYDGTTINVNSNSELQVVNPLPTSNSADSTKVLTVDSNGAPVWAAAQGGTTYSAGDGITISNDTIAADVDGTTIGIDSTTKKIKLLSQIPVVDQTYSASSTNAQSGTAVASAIAAVPTKPLVAGSNITITENANNVTLAATDTTYTFSTGLTNTSGTVTVTNPVPAVTSSDDGKVLQATYSGGSGSFAWVTPSSGGASGDQYVYHAPAHSIIFCFEDTSYNPTTDSNVSSLGTWTQLSSGSNIWQLTMSTGSWADKFYNVGTGSTKLSQRCEILSIDFTGVTSLNTFMKGAQITRIREIRSNIECSASGAFQGTTELRGHVEFPALHGTTFAYMFRNSGIDSIRINSLYGSLTPGYEGDPEMGEMGADDWYEGATCSNMFYDCRRLRNVEIYGAHVGACDSMFRYCDSLTEIPCMEAWEFCGGSFSYMFYECRSLIWVPNISCNHPAWQGSMDQYSNGGNTDNMFYGCISLQRLPYFSGYFGECFSTAFMFFNCSSLLSIKWENISELGYYTYMEWDEDSQMETPVSTYVVQNVSQMFQNCGNVIHGAVGVYQGMTNSWHQISQHGGTFSNCGTDVGSTERSSIPTSWGGTGA